MAQIKLYLANTIFSTEINEKWHNLNEKWHNSNYIWQTQYFQPKSMKNGTVQSRVKINEGEQYIVNLSKSRRTHSLVSYVVDHFVERNIRLILIVKVNFRVLCNHFPQVSGRQNLLCCSDLLSAVGNLFAIWIAEGNLP